MSTAFEISVEPDWNNLAFLSGLPARYRHRYTPLFVKQLVVCVIVATEKLADPHRVGQGIFSCVAEELAAHMIISEAEGLLLADRGEHGSTNGTTDFGGIYELLFEDIDFDWLYGDMDGIERDEEAVSQLGIAHLEFDKWFHPFLGRSVHSYVAAED